MFSDHYDLEKFSLNYNRSFDSTGIILQKKEYHPLTICTYGILCHDKFLASGDSSYFYKAKNQYAYFQDTSKLKTTFNGKGIGLPYQFNYLDLKAPWYSGLTQGIALSFLLRCEKLFQDNYAKEIAEKICYHMVQADSLGGTLSTTKEGNLWIEEYPKSKKSINVLNGFIIGLIGLKEYTDCFPQDSSTKAIHQEVYESLLESIPFYNTGEWSKYNRNNLNISNQYLRFQISQMNHLYKLYKNESFRNQMMIWAMQIENKFDKELKFYLFPDYFYSRTLKQDSLNKKQYHFMLDTMYQQSTDFVIVRPSKGEKNQTIPIKRIRRIVLNKGYYTVKLFVRDTSFMDKILSASVWINNRPVSLKEFKMHKNSLELNSDSLFTNIEFRFKKSKNAKSMEIDSILVPIFKPYFQPQFTHRILDTLVEIHRDSSYRIQVHGKHLEGCKVFYRTSSKRENIKKEPWEYSRIALVNKPIRFQKNGFYEFFISIPIESDSIELHHFSIQEFPLVQE